MATYTDAQIADMLLEKHCKRFTYASADMADESEMVVRWPVSHNKMQEVVEFLDKWPTGDLYVAAPGVQRSYVTNPTVEHEQYSGTWRVVRNWYDAEMPGYVFQTRRKGFLDSVVDGGDLLWAEARLISGRDHTVFKLIDSEGGSPGDPVDGETDDYVVFGWRGLDKQLLPNIAKAVVDLANDGTAATHKTFDPIKSYNGTTTSEDWRMLPPQYQVESDGSGSLTVAFVRFGVTITSYSSIHGEVTTKSVVEQVTEEQAQARIEELKAASTTLTHSVSGSRSQDGVVTIRYSVLIPNPDFYTYEVTPEEGHTEYHKIAWEVVPPADGQIDVSYDPQGVTFTAKRTRVGSLRRNPHTQRYSYHVVVWDDGEQISSDSASPNTTYRLFFQKRTKWSIANNMYWDQTQITCYGHEMCTFGSFTAANAWIGGATPNAPSYELDGVPMWGESSNPAMFATADTPSPRLVGKNKWLASRRVIAWQTGWYPYEPS